MNPTSDKVFAFVKDVRAGASDTLLQQKYGLSSKKVFLYKAAAREILTNRQEASLRPVRKISAQNFLGDMKSGMADLDLMVKYNVSPRQLQKLFGKVIATGLVTPRELADCRAVGTPSASTLRKAPLGFRWKKLTVPLLVVLVAVAALLMTNRAVTPKEATWDDVLQEAKSGGYQIITTDELKQRWQREPDKVMLVDTRQDWEFNSGHIRGAVSFPMEPTWWSRWKKRDSMQAALGPDMNRFIVFY